MSLRSVLLTVPVTAALTLGGITAAHAVSPAPDPGAPVGQERVYDPSTLIAVPNGGGLLAPDGTNICDVPDPLNVVDAEGTAICFTGVVAGPGGTDQPSGGPTWLPPHTGVVVGPDTGNQVEHMPVGGVDTGVTAEPSSDIGAIVPGLTVAAVLALGGVFFLKVYLRSLR